MPGTRCFLRCPKELTGHMHVFPDPARSLERFKKWVQFVGGELNTSDDYAFYRKRMLCDRHFTLKDRNRCNRLNALAVPSIAVVKTAAIIENSTFMYCTENSTTVKSEPASYSTVVDMEEDPLKITEDPISNNSPILDNSLPKPTVAQQAMYPENSTTVKFHTASYSTVVDMEEDPLKITEDPISNTSIIEDVVSPQTPEGISCLSPIMDVPSPQAEEVTISCTSPILDNSPPKPTVAQQAMYPGSDVFAALNNHNYSKFQVPQKSNAAAPDNKFQVPQKFNVAAPSSKFEVPQKLYGGACRASDFNKFNAFVPLSDYKCQKQQVRVLKQQVYSLKKRILSFRSRLKQALKPSAAFEKVTKNMTEPAKIFTKMQFFQTPKKPGGRRFSSEEKNLALSLYKNSPQSYSFLADCFTLPSIKTIRAMLAQEKLGPYLTLYKNATLPSKKTLVQESLEPYLTLDKNSTSPTKITLKDVLLEDNFKPYHNIEQPHLTLDENSTSPAIIALKDVLPEDNFEPYHNIEQPHLTLDEHSTLPSKIILKDMLPKDNFEPYLTIEQNCRLPFRITLKDILAHKQLEPYLTFKKNSTSPSKTTCAKEKPEPHRTIKKKSTLPSKKALKGILTQEMLQPYFAFNKSSPKTYTSKRKARTEAD